MAEPRTRTGFLALLGALGLTLVACGGGSGSDASTSSTTTTTSSTTTTTEPSAPDADLDSSPKTEAGTLTAADLGGDWKVYEGETVENKGATPGCWTEDPDATVASATAKSDGKIHQRGSLTRFARTSTHEFGDEAAAEAFAQWRMSDVYVECDRLRAETGFATEEGKSVASYGVDRATGDGAYRGSYSLEYDEVIDGESYAVSWSTVLVYRSGTVVMVAFLEQAPAQGDAETLGDDVYNEVVRAMEKVVARASG